jgi:glycosyltransferase involved in cell wall biosynthesis
MQVLHVLNSELGGANRAALRLHDGLCLSGCDSKVLVRKKSSNDPNIYSMKNAWQQIRADVASRAATIARKRVAPNHMWNIDVLPSPTVQRINQLAPDVVNLHWLGSGYIPFKDLVKIKPPVVWTFHDMEAFTGGCFYDEECGRYVDSCGNCPQLKKSGENDLSHRTWKSKKEIHSRFKPLIVCPSNWLAECSRNSSILKSHQIDVIPYGLDLEAFRPVEKREARKKLKLPTDKKIVLFGAVSSTRDSRKGFDLLVEAERQLVALNEPNIFLAVFGSPQPYEQMGMKTPGQSLGLVNNDETLANIYSAADVFVAPSRQDNLPNTVIESLACGTPVVAFQIGGMPDMIDHKKTGFLAPAFDCKQLAEGIQFCVSETNNPKLCDESRRKAKAEFPLSLQAERYLDLYRSLLQIQ